MFWGDTIKVTKFKVNIMDGDSSTRYLKISVERLSHKEVEHYKCIDKKFTNVQNEKEEVQLRNSCRCLIKCKYVHFVKRV